VNPDATKIRRSIHGTCSSSASARTPLGVSRFSEWRHRLTDTAPWSSYRPSRFPSGQAPHPSSPQPEAQKAPSPAATRARRHPSRERALLPCRSVVTARRSRRTPACGTLAQAWSSPASAPAPVLGWLHPLRHGEGLAARWPRGRRSEVVHLPARRRRPLRGQPRRRAARGPRALRSRLLRICTQTYSLSLSLSSAHC
jgi:hypothetical protein